MTLFLKNLETGETFPFNGITTVELITDSDMNRKAKWVKVKGNIMDGKVIYKCSLCGQIAIWERGMESIYPSDFCKSCHADMVCLRTACLD